MPKYQLTEPSDRESTLARTFDAPRRLVFGAFTKPEMVKQWLCETLVATTFVERDGRTLVSGTVRYASQVARDGAVKTAMIEAWSQGHDRLDEMLAAMGVHAAP